MHKSMTRIWKLLKLRQHIQKQPPECSVKNGVLKNFAKLTRKDLRQSLHFNKAAGPKLLYRNPSEDLRAIVSQYAFRNLAALQQP